MTGRLGAPCRGRAHRAGPRLLHRDAHAVEGHTDRSGRGRDLDRVDQDILDVLVIGHRERTHHMGHPLEAGARVGQPPILPRRRHRVPRGPLLHRVRHDLRRARQPALLHHPRAQADRVDHPARRLPAALARLAVQRSLDRHRSGQGVVRRLAPAHLGVADTANHDGRHVDVQRLQNGAVRGPLDAARPLGDRSLHPAVVNRLPAPRPAHRALHLRHHRRQRLPEIFQLVGDLDDQLGHVTSSPSGASVVRRN